jgi:DNA uptake protein ComE-like DNA-binding protein
LHKAQLYRILIVVAIVVTFGLSVFAAISALTAPAPTNTNTNTINVNSPPIQAVKTVAYTEGLPNINRCSREALVALPDIGEVLADRIIAGRPYADVFELDRVDGIGPGIIASISGKVVAE